MTGYQVGFWNLENLFAPEGFAGREPWVAQRPCRVDPAVVRHQDRSADDHHLGAQQ